MRRKYNSEGSERVVVGSSMRYIVGSGRRREKTTELGSMHQDSGSQLTHWSVKGVAADSEIPEPCRAGNRGATSSF
jgi:hypothetical protein